MEVVFIVIFWVCMAILSGAIARKKRGFWVGLAFVFVGLVAWPLTLIAAYAMSAREAPPLRADGFIAGKPYWGDERKGYVARVDGHDLAFRSIDEMQTALGSEATPLEQEPELIGQKVWRKIKEY